MAGGADDVAGAHDVGQSPPVNFIAHVHVALALGRGGGDDEAAVAFGAALPDLASMAGIRLDRSRLPAAVAEGVALHHATDTAFHSHPAFVAGVRSLVADLKGRGIGVGPSRAVGHAGWELLLDGCLLERPGVAQGFGRVLEAAPDVALAVAPADPEWWRGLLASMRTDRWWLGYRNPEVVALRLERRLRDRRRLSLAAADVPVAAQVLAAARSTVDLAADAIVEAVVLAVDRPGFRGGREE